MKVTILVGAHAYACIEQEGRKTDFLLTPGKGAPASLRDTAAELRQEAARKQALADLADAAAEKLETDGYGNGVPNALGRGGLLVDVKETQGGATIRASVEGREHVFYVGSAPAADLARCADVSEADAVAKRALTAKLDERARVARLLAIKYEKGLP
jgi:hypothetical protein